MDMLDFGVPEANVNHEAPLPTPSPDQPLHRLAEVRRLQGITRRTLARRLNCDINTIKEQELPTTDLPLSMLYQWQKVLEVPVAELLVEEEEPLSAPVMKRAQMVRLMKTAAAILERSQQPAIQRMAQMLVEQLVEVMPELKGVSPWHAVGRRRTQDELGAAAHRRITSDVFHDLVD